MKKLQILSSKFLVMIFCLLTVHAAHAKKPSKAQCEAGLQVTVTDMDFGSFVGGTSGTIVLDTTGTMTHTGVIPVGGTVGVAATYDLVALKGCDKKKITFVMPGTITINNVSGSPSTTLTITNLVTDLPKNPFKVKDVSTIKIGGTLTVNSGGTQAPYTGPFDVTFTIN